MSFNAHAHLWSKEAYIDRVAPSVILSGTVTAGETVSCCSPCSFDVDTTSRRLVVLFCTDVELNHRLVIIPWRASNLLDIAIAIASPSVRQPHSWSTPQRSKLSRCDFDDIEVWFIQHGVVQLVPWHVSLSSYKLSCMSSAYTCKLPSSRQSVHDVNHDVVSDRIRAS